MLLPLLHVLIVASVASPALAQEPVRPPRYHLDAAQANRLFSNLRGKDFPDKDVYDEAVWFRRKPGLDIEELHPEIPGGKWRMRTNSLGLRMDRDLANEPAEISLLLTGDANMEGVCSNSDTIAGRVERSLAALHPGASIEVVNSGKGSYTFYNYVLVLERFAARKPKMFVVLVCLNDFEECLSAYYHFSGTPGPAFADGDARELVEVGRDWTDELAQGLMALWRFDRQPGELDTALAVGAGLMGELAGTCAALGTELVVFWCPPYFSLDAAKAQQELAKPCAELGLDALDLASADAIATRFLHSVRGMRLTAIDLRPTFAKAREPMFWTDDRHLSLAANELIAREISARYETLAAREKSKAR
ncbi:MAG: hypothetical protein HZA52_04775 [Planctomycetes bacterium]|nr:hypothetical protein [Planctomycetota bacterium]